MLADVTITIMTVVGMVWISMHIFRVVMRRTRQVWDASVQIVHTRSQAMRKK